MEKRQPPSPAPVVEGHDLPILAITLGDPTGIGPEIVVSALRQSSLYGICRPLVIGHPELLRREIERGGWGAEVDEGGLGAVGGASPERLVCMPTGSDGVLGAELGTVDARGGQAAYEYLVEGARLALRGDVAGIVTAPLHKGALHAAGHDWPGHTELLAHVCGVESFAMMLYLPPSAEGSGMERRGPVGLGMVHVTLHMAMREIFSHLTVESVYEKIALAYRTFAAFYGVRATGLWKGLPGMLERDRPRIAVAALNPHGGEQGLFGDEEGRIIEPAVRRARERGWDVEGPLPVDTLMPKAVRGEYDAVVAMYHDQGHITLKLLDMFHAVNITLGLPIVRTSVAHGTAHDQAGCGTADAGGMVEAIRAAAWLSAARRRGDWGVMREEAVRE